MHIDWTHLRREIIGHDATILTPYGERRVLYADYTASGRGLACIERYVGHLLELYANTHTQDDTTGRLTSRRLASAEDLIRRHLNADHRYKLISLGSGATAAVTRLQQILGVFIPPATRERLRRRAGAAWEKIVERSHLPVVFVGPYEHHSNEISWREGLCEVVEVELDERGFLSLSDLEAKLEDPRYQGRERIGSFSAASNVSGIRTDVYAVARILHRHGALAFFDFSAAAPYVTIDVRHDDESYFDGVFFSPHKYLGGPGASGILLIREEIYHADLPPSVAGGGTVRFVNAQTQDYVEDIEEREKAGTPAILQTIRAAVAIDLQRLLGPEKIEARERVLIARAVERLSAVPGMEIIGNAPPEERLAILAFNIRPGHSYLHPRFVVRLLNDLFGIQSRAGCSCAGPYGHRLLHIDLETSERYRRFIGAGHEGIKPGWVRLNFHYLMTDAEFDYVCEAVEFAARHGRLFLADYRFDEHTGAWSHILEDEEIEAVGVAPAFAATDYSETQHHRWDHESASAVDEEQLMNERRAYLVSARARAAELTASFSAGDVQETSDELIPFSFIADHGR